MTVNVHSVKLKRDINLKYFYAMLEKWDTIEVIHKNRINWLLEVRILTSRIKNYIWRQWYIYGKFLK
jgi:hypothetical protein